MNYFTQLTAALFLTATFAQAQSAEQLCAQHAASKWENGITQGVLPDDIQFSAIPACLNAVTSDPTGENIYRLARALYFLDRTSQSYELILEHRDNPYPPIQNFLGIMYFNGYGGLVANEARARDFYARAASGGFAPAQYNLGWMYLNGAGVELDYSTALTHFRDAAAQEYPDALGTIGWMYETGSGVIPSQRNAIIYYDAASKLGAGYASSNLGLLEERAENYEMARHYFRLAEEQGFDASDSIARVEESIGSTADVTTGSVAGTDERADEITDMIVDETIKFGVNQTLNYLFGGD